MDKTVALLLALVLTASTVVNVLPAKAEARTIIVPDDYSTIQDAIDAAYEGDTIFVRKGTYESGVNQTLIINKTLSLIGEDADQTILSLHPEWVTSMILYQEISGYAHPILIEANNVTISGFTIMSDGGEISVNGNGNKIINNILKAMLRAPGSYTVIAQNTITARMNIGGFYSHIYANNIVNASIDIINGSFNSIYSNNVVGGGIGAGGTSVTNLIYNNTVRNGRGIWACYGDIVINNTVMESARGISIAWGFNNIVYRNIIVNNQGPGLLKITGDNNTFYANYVANNDYGAFILNSGDNVLFHNNFVGNGQQVKTDAAKIREFEGWAIYDTDLQGGNFDNGKRGNYWSDYVGEDVNGDGIGDVPYVIDASRQDNYPLITPFDVDSIKIKLPDWASLSAIETSEFNSAEPSSIFLALTVTGASAVVVSISLLVYSKKIKKEKWLWALRFKSQEPKDFPKQITFFLYRQV